MTLWVAIVVMVSDNDMVISFVDVDSNIDDEEKEKGGKAFALAPHHSVSSPSSKAALHLHQCQRMKMKQVRHIR